MKILFALLFCFSFANAEEIYIKLGEAKTTKSKMAITPLAYLGNPSSTSNFQSVGAELFSVLNNDMTVSSYFDLLSKDAFLEDVSKVSLKPKSVESNGFKFESWQAIKTDFLVRVGYSISGNDLNVEAYLYHVPKSKMIFGRKYKGSVSAARKIAHTFSNDILDALTGSTGMFNSKIVATSDKDGGGWKEVLVMDWDGANPIKITNHKTITLSPSWSPDGKKIAYTAFVVRSKTKMRNADMFIYELESGRRYIASYKPGYNSGACFAPDNKHIYLTLSEKGSPDIFKMTFDGEVVSTLTHGPNGAMNVEPAISADGKKLAFSSDRSGRPMLYTMNSDGTNIKRITFAGVFNSAPSWSPDGTKIAFAGQSEDHFDIFVMNADGSEMKRLTSAKKPSGKWSSNEDPSFSPDGRFVMYTSNRTGKNQIYISTVDGSEERRVTSDSANYFKPKWSKNFE